MIQYFFKLFPALYPEIENIYGIDWSDYYIDKNSYNPIVFIHKKFLPKKTIETSHGKNQHDEHRNDKCQQFDYDRLHTETCKTKIINSEHKDALVDQTIKFAKDIIPITIPPSTDIAHPCHYIVESCKKTKRKHEPQDYKIEHKEKCKHTLNVHQRKCKRNKDSSSTTSATHYSPNDTIDDINDHQLSCSLSEISEQKPKREVVVDKNKKVYAQNTKLVASDSFEAIATEYMNTQSEAKIKIHLMHDKDKNLLCENIRLPIMKAMKESSEELKNQDKYHTEMQNVNKTIRCHEKKLENILEKLSWIENKLDLLAKLRQSPRIKVLKAAKLEELSQNIGNFKEDSSEEELACVNFPSKSRGKNTPVTPMFNEKDAERDFRSVDNLGRGENVPEFQPSSSQIGIKPERSNRIPARFCWTDTVMK